MVRLARAGSIAQRYESIAGFTSGFDYLRLVLAAGVVLIHSFVASYGKSGTLVVWTGWHRIFSAPIVPAFFALSGFLVCGSLKRRPTITAFITLRALRLMPALAVEVLLSAVVLGGAVTVLPRAQYYTRWEFFRYFENIVGRIQMHLPGVFLSNPYPKIVNISLWTIPYELECYAGLILLYGLGVIDRRIVLLCVIAVSIAVGTAFAFSGYDPYWAANRPLGRALVVAFLCGIAINLYADRVKLDRRLAIACIVAMILCCLDYRMIYLAAVPIAYLTVYLGMLNPARRGPLFRGDYSYGLYVFAFPIQQTLSFAVPELRHWYLNAPATVVLGLGYASFSWHCVEKPVLDRKKQLLALAEAGRERAFSVVGLRPKLKSEERRV